MDAYIIKILEEAKTIAVVGASPNTSRPSNYISEYLMDYYAVVPVNPGHDILFGEVCYPSISEIPGLVDIVNIFRNSNALLPIVKEAIQRNDIKLIWMQDHVINEEARELAIQHHIPVVMNDCIYRVHRTII